MKRLGLLLCWVGGLYMLVIIAYNLVPLPPVPIEVTYRPSLKEQGVLVTFQNKTNRTLHLAMQIKHPITEEGSLTYVMLQPNEAKEISWKNFKVQSGDGILVLSGGEYKKTGFVVP